MDQKEFRSRTPDNPEEWAAYLRRIYPRLDPTLEDLSSEGYKLLLAREIGIQEVISHIEILAARKISEHKHAIIA